jgi:hypothetical protein
MAMREVKDWAPPEGDDVICLSPFGLIPGTVHGEKLSLGR